MSFGANINKIFCYAKVWHKICFIWRLFMKNAGPGTPGPETSSICRMAKFLLYLWRSII